MVLAGIQKSVIHGINDSIIVGITKPKYRELPLYSSSSSNNIIPGGKAGIDTTIPSQCTVSPWPIQKLDESWRIILG